MIKSIGSKYQMSVISQGYKHTAVLRVKNMSREDIGSYYCYAENSMGSARDDVTVYSKYLPNHTLMDTSRKSFFLSNIITINGEIVKKKSAV